jgi:hypothetical protein
MRQMPGRGNHRNDVPAGQQQDVARTVNPSPLAKIRCPVHGSWSVRQNLSWLNCGDARTSAECKRLLGVVARIPRHSVCWTTPAAATPPRGSTITDSADAVLGIHSVHPIAVGNGELVAVAVSGRWIRRSFRGRCRRARRAVQSPRSYGPAPIAATAAGRRGPAAGVPAGSDRSRFDDLVRLRDRCPIAGEQAVDDFVTGGLECAPHVGDRFFEEVEPLDGVDLAHSYEQSLTDAENAGGGASSRDGGIPPASCEWGRMPEFPRGVDRPSLRPRDFRLCRDMMAIEHARR